MLVRAEAGGHKADLTVSRCKGGSSRLPLLQRSFLEAILVSGTFSGMLPNPKLQGLGSGMAVQNTNLS